MGHHKSESPRYPKSHIMAASGIAAALSIFLLVIPTTEVEAKRTLVQLDLHEVTAEHKEPVLSEELDALISETVTFSSPIELTSIQGNPFHRRLPRGCQCRPQPAACAPGGPACPSGVDHHDGRCRRHPVDSFPECRPVRQYPARCHQQQPGSQGLYPPARRPTGGVQAG